MSADNTEDGWCVYVLHNPDGKLYIGISDNVEHRLHQHNAGQSKWTKRKGPWQIVWTSQALSFSRARKLESKLKSQKGGDGFYKMTGLSRQARL
jgi:putative endonuclease